MPVLDATLDEAILSAVALAVLEDDAPLSAWPDRYPGRWATAARIVELTQCRRGEISHRLSEMVRDGRILAEQPWPATLRGYQPTTGSDAPDLVLPPVVTDERQWMLDAMRRWGLLHGGFPPRQRDWCRDADPDGRWPRASRVAERFEGEALAQGLRRFVHRRCAADCSCSIGRHYTNEAGETICDGCFDCLGSCPHGSMGEWVGPSGWQYALRLAGF